MNVKQIRKSMNKTEQLYRDLVATPYGSLIKTYQILNGCVEKPESFIKRLKKADFPFIDDEEFIQKTLEAVGYDYEHIKNMPVALCENEYNSIFCPFIVGTDNGEVVLLPLFPDCTLLRSQELAMANDSYKIIDWEAAEDMEFENCDEKTC